MLSFLNKPLLFSFVFFGLASQIFAQTSEPLLSFSSFPDDLNLSCSDGMPSEIEYPIVALDTLGTSCNGTQSLFYLDLTVPGDCPNSYVLQRTWSAEICGETISSLQSFTFSDTTPPVIIRPIDGAHLCEIDLVNIYPAAQDNCQSYVSLNFNASESIPCEGVILRTYDITVSDNCGNTTIESRSIYIHDQAPPTFSSVPPSLTLSCEDAVILESATYDCEMGMTYSEGGEVSYPNCSGSFVQTQTYSLTDVCGATANASRVITVEDNIPPILEIPEDLSLSCPEVPVLELATAFDVCTNENLAVFEEIDTVVSNCGLMTLVRTFSATDACGNTASGIQTISVTDTLSPVFSFIPSDYEFDCTDALPSDEELGYATATDECSEVLITLNEVITDGDCPLSYLRERVFTAVDGCGNSASATQRISVSDNTAPQIVLSADTVFAECGGDLVNDPPEIMDDCSDFTVTSSISYLPEGTCLGQVISTFTYVATDVCGNSSTATKTVIVTDNIAPVFTTFPADTVLSCDDDIPLELPTFNDDCSTSSIIETVSEELGDCPGERNVTRTFTISDPCGNTDTRIQSIAFTDTTPPTFAIVPPDLLEVYWLDGDTIPFPVTEIMDDCDPDAVLTMDESSSVDESEGSDLAQTITRTYLATDGCQNTTTLISTIVYYPQIIQGCSDSNACNYDPDANVDDGCVYNDVFGICNGDNTLQGAIDATIASAEAGGSNVLVVPSGTYNPVSISSSITLQGDLGAVINAAGHLNGISVTGPSVTVEGIAILGDGNTVSGIEILTGADNAVVRNCDISGMALANPVNGSPLSYGVLCYQNNSNGTPVSGTLIEGNTFHDISGAAISLSTNGATGTQISDNTFSNITPVYFEGEFISIGIQAASTTDLSVFNNSFHMIIGATSVLLSNSIDIYDNSYSSVSALHIETTTDNAAFSSLAYWARAEVNIPGNSNVLKVYFANLDGEIANPGAFTFANDGSEVVDSNGETYVQDCHGVWGGSGILTDCGCDIFDVDLDGVCPDDEVEGCTDVTACNYDPLATEEDNSCIEDPVGFDCNGDLTPNEFCGTGTVWNAESGECQVVTFGPACYFDTNQNGTVDSADLLTLLAAYGLICE